MPALDRETLVRREPHVLAEAVGDVVVVLDPDSDAYVRLNRTGARLWLALEEPQTVGTLAEGLARAYDLDDERALADTASYVAELVARGFAATT